MGARGRAGRAAILATALFAAARAEADVQVEPVARLTLEGGYDSNPLYDGRGGGGVGRASPDVGLRLRDHTWDAGLVAGGDFLEYQNRAARPVWNQRGRLTLNARPSPRSDVQADVSAVYAGDPLGLARLGIFGRTGSALVGTGSARAAWRLDPLWTVAGTFAEHVVRFDVGDGAASHEPGVELLRRFDRRFDVGGSYRFAYFQGLGAGAPDATAHQAQAVARYRWTRRSTLQAELGPAIWTAPSGGTSALPQGSLQLLTTGRWTDLRLTLRHGVGIGLLATPGLVDTVEVAATHRLGRLFEVHVEGGLWRSGDIPWGANGVLGYGVDGEVAWLIGGGVRLGLAASRFARADQAVTTFDRNTFGVRLGWELPRR